MRLLIYTYIIITKYKTSEIIRADKKESMMMKQRKKKYFSLKSKLKEQFIFHMGIRRQIKTSMSNVEREMEKIRSIQTYQQ